MLLLFVLFHQGPAFMVKINWEGGRKAGRKRGREGGREGDRKEGRWEEPGKLAFAVCGVTGWRRGEGCVLITIRMERRDLISGVILGTAHGKPPIGRRFLIHQLAPSGMRSLTGPRASRHAVSLGGRGRPICQAAVRGSQRRSKMGPDR